jgi:NAD(P)-dependent dehydrogenase (short-subunit alcohol dehydrogenase family)
LDAFMTDLPTPDLTGRIALVTGASRGIGYHLAKQLAAAGAHVIAVARTVGGLEELDDEIKAAGGSATLVPLDLTDMAGIDRLGGSIHQRWGKLDILVANAGVLGVIAPIGHVEAKVFDKVMAVNVTGTWRLIRSVDPLLRLSDAGRAIVMSSGSAHSARAFWAPYAASKAAVEALARSWADETKNMPLRVNIVDPGIARTAMRALAMPGEDPLSVPLPADVAARIVPLASPTLTETGRIWNVSTMRFTSHRRPE